MIGPVRCQILVFTFQLKSVRGYPGDLQQVLITVGFVRNILIDDKSESRSVKGKVLFDIIVEVEIIETQGQGRNGHIGYSACEKLPFTGPAVFIVFLVDVLQVSDE